MKNSLSRLWLTFLLFLALASLGSVLSCSRAPKPMTAEEVLESEQVIEGLRAPLSALSKSVMNLEFPDHQSRYVFEPLVEVTDLGGGAPESSESILDLDLKRRRWPVAASSQSARSEEISLWSGFLDTVEFFHHFKFYNVRGNFEGAGRSAYRTQTGFKGLAQLKSGKIGAVEGKLAIEWKRRSESSGEEEQTVWRIAELKTAAFRITETKQPLFSDVGDVAFDAENRARLAHSQRDEGFISMVLSIRFGEKELEELIATVRPQFENGTYPAIDANQASVVDIDRDGYDDFYFTASDGPALFFKNLGDGRFKEVSQELGLNLSRVHSATFADFDNDGDSDVFLSLFNRENATRYLRNVNGRFVDAGSLVEGGLPSWILSISVADYNNDGLLDVYLGGYAGAYLAYMEVANERALARGETPTDRIPWLSEEESKKIFQLMRSPDAHPISNIPGPSNWLLENLGGGRFRKARNSESTAIAFNTMATGWSDIDRDGDMDLYVVNEGGPNQLLNNSGGTFTDISNKDSGEIGFGMGVSFGDYDNDGRTDVYTTNMFSKAGTRIAEQMQSSEIVAQSARGNSLIRNGPDGFYKVSGLEPPALQVEAADFGWGGSFADLNNDGHLDIYVPAGLYSMPAEVATIGDS